METYKTKTMALYAVGGMTKTLKSLLESQNEMVEDSLTVAGSVADPPAVIHIGNGSDLSATLDSAGVEEVKMDSNVCSNQGLARESSQATFIDDDSDSGLSEHPSYESDDSDYQDTESDIGGSSLTSSLYGELPNSKRSNNLTEIIGNSFMEAPTGPDLTLSPQTPLLFARTTDAEQTNVKETQDAAAAVFGENSNVSELPEGAERKYSTSENILSCGVEREVFSADNERAQVMSVDDFDFRSLRLADGKIESHDLARFLKEFRILVDLLGAIVRDDEVDLDDGGVRKLPNPGHWLADSRGTLVCDFCHADIFNRGWSCLECEERARNGDQMVDVGRRIGLETVITKPQWPAAQTTDAKTPFDICMECYGHSRSCEHSLRKFEMREQYDLAVLWEILEQAKRTIAKVLSSPSLGLDFEGKQELSSWLSPVSGPSFDDSEEMPMTFLAAVHDRNWPILVFKDSSITIEKARAPSALVEAYKSFESQELTSIKRKRHAVDKNHEESSDGEPTAKRQKSNKGVLGVTTGTARRGGRGDGDPTYQDEPQSKFPVSTIAGKRKSNRRSSNIHDQSDIPDLMEFLAHVPPEGTSRWTRLAPVLGTYPQRRLVPSDFDKQEFASAVLRYALTKSWTAIQLRIERLREKFADQIEQERAIWASSVMQQPDARLVELENSVKVDFVEELWANFVVNGYEGEWEDLPFNVSEVCDKVNRRRSIPIQRAHLVQHPATNAYPGIESQQRKTQTHPPKLTPKSSLFFRDPALERGEISDEFGVNGGDCLMGSAEDPPQDGGRSNNELRKSMPLKSEDLSGLAVPTNANAIYHLGDLVLQTGNPSPVEHLPATLETRRVESQAPTSDQPLSVSELSQLQSLPSFSDNLDINSGATEMVRKGKASAHTTSLFTSTKGDRAVGTPMADESHFTRSSKLSSGRETIILDPEVARRAVQSLSSSTKRSGDDGVPKRSSGKSAGTRRTLKSVSRAKLEPVQTASDNISEVPPQQIASFVQDPHSEPTLPHPHNRKRKALPQPENVPGHLMSQTQALESERNELRPQSRKRRDLSHPQQIKHYQVRSSDRSTRAQAAAQLQHEEQLKFLSAGLVEQRPRRGISVAERVSQLTAVRSLPDRKRPKNIGGSDNNISRGETQPLNDFDDEEKRKGGSSKNRGAPGSNSSSSRRTDQILQRSVADQSSTLTQGEAPAKLNAVEDVAEIVVADYLALAPKPEHVRPLNGEAPERLPTPAPLYSTELGSKFFPDQVDHSLDGEAPERLPTPAPPYSAELGRLLLSDQVHLGEGPMEPLLEIASVVEVPPETFVRADAPVVESPQEPLDRDVNWVYESARDIFDREVTPVDEGAPIPRQNSTTAPEGGAPSPKPDFVPPFGGSLKMEDISEYGGSEIDIFEPYPTVEVDATTGNSDVDVAYRTVSDSV
ncbi:hypothetical protein HDU93_007679 [Gonapodya sp. JEL0774]|nr:hypothetical protein HDU93_007679 [Gonapodya sp. JEL0774]